MSKQPRKPLMRSLGEFCGHIAKAVKTDPNRKTIRKSVEQQERGNVTMRRTTIDEIVLRDER